ncbi:unnamed protein product [Polarella glacialis]|uniref:RING-type domain-containing protein n=1 Tax=Polarella glacialis TaxID=89957 RepID=A0A813HHM8_POLGL|nr:unnamed protein product [Polarella glacialis]
MWVRALRQRPELQERYYDLLAESNGSDTAHAELYCDEEACEAMLAAFRQRHGDAVPVGLREANSAKAAQIRSLLSASTVVCSQALMSVLRKGGLRCDLDELLREGEARARKLVPMKELREDEARCLAEACALAEIADPSFSAAAWLTTLDIFEPSSKALSLDSAVVASEYFPSAGSGLAVGRVEVDRRALDRVAAHQLFGDCLSCPISRQPSSAPASGYPAESQASPVSAGGAKLPSCSSCSCWCPQSLLVGALHAARASKGVAKPFGRERLVAQLATQAKGHESVPCPIPVGRGHQYTDFINKSSEGGSDGNCTQCRAVLARCGPALQRRVDEARKELAQQWEPEVQRLRAEAEGFIVARELASASAREVTVLKQRCAEVEEQLVVTQDATSRQAVAAQEAAIGLRRALVRRREMLEKALCAERVGGAVDAEMVRSAMEEIRAALLEEEKEARRRRCCCICAEAPVDAVLLPCRHQQLCMTCAQAVQLCPICRAVIDSRLQVYL